MCWTKYKACAHTNHCESTGQLRPCVIMVKKCRRPSFSGVTRLLRFVELGDNADWKISELFCEIFQIPSRFWHNYKRFCKRHSSNLKGLSGWVWAVALYRWAWHSGNVKRANWSASQSVQSLLLTFFLFFCWVTVLCSLVTDFELLTDLLKWRVEVLQKQAKSHKDYTLIISVFFFVCMRWRLVYIRCTVHKNESGMNHDRHVCLCLESISMGR